jgi:hypothetical protein
VDVFLDNVQSSISKDKIAMNNKHIDSTLSSVINKDTRTVNSTFIKQEVTCPICNESIKTNGLNSKFNRHLD